MKPDLPRPARARIAFVLPNMRGGGAERVATTIMRELVARGFEVDLVLLRAEGELLELVPAEVRIVDLGARRIFAGLLPLARYLCRRKPDAVQVRMWPLTIVGILAHRLARSRARLVVSDHCALSQQYGHLPRALALLKASVRLFYPLADTRILVSAGAADDLAELSGLNRDTFTVVYNPVPKPAPAAPSPEIDALWGVPDGRIINAGTLKSQKNQALLIAAFARLRRRRPAKLMILGEGPLLADLQAKAEAEGVEADVIFAGFTSSPAAYLASADLFVLSSDYEGFGNVLVEAMQEGVSVVSTDCPSGPREILGDGRFGRLTPCGDADALAEAMAAELADPHDPEALKAQARALSGEGVIDRYVELLVGPKAISGGIPAGDSEIAAG